MCMGVAKSCSISNPYWLKSDMESEVRTLQIRLSPTIYVSFALRKCGKLLQKLMQL